MKLPAYGKDLLHARRAGKRPADFVLVTDWWQLAELHQKVVGVYALVCDPLAAPYDFSLLQSLDVILAHVSRDALGCAQRIAQAAPASLIVVSGYEDVMQVMVGNLETVIARRSSRVAA